MDTVRVVSAFFKNSPKRFFLLCEKIKELVPSARHTHLIDVCRTRWVARIDDLAVFIELFQAIADALERIKLNVGGHWNNESTQQASQVAFFTALLVSSLLSHWLLFRDVSQLPDH